jgi:hypothetical protein
MARDVEFNVTASDKTGPALESAWQKFKRTNDKIEKESEKSNAKVAKRFESVVGPKIAASLTKAFAGAGDAVAPLLGGAVVAAAPFMAATLSAALIAGAAVGAAGLGVALVSQDAKVNAAGKRLGKTLMSALQQDAAPFITPVLNGIHTIEAEFEGMRGRIQSIFRNAARFVDPLVHGATKGFEGILRGVDALVANAAPVVASLDRGLTKVGASFGDFLEDVAGNGDDAARALDAVFDALSGILQITGPLVGGLTKVFGFLDKIGVVGSVAQQLLGPLGTLVPLLDKTGDGARRSAAGTFGAAQSFESLAVAATLPVEPLKSVADRMHDATEQARGLYGSMTSAAQAVADATAKIKENGKGLSLNTEKGRQNRKALEDVAGALSANYDAYVKVNGAGGAAAGVANRNRAAFIRLAEKAGLASGEAKRLANQLLGIPARRNVTVQANIRQAEQAAAAIQRKIDGLRGKTVNVTVHYRGDGSNQNSPSIGGGGGRTFNAASYWSAVNGQSTARAGGPTQVTVDQALSVSLDGQPFRAMTARAISESEKRTAWRTKVGVR